jgi:HK97 family phage prohead protease
MRSTANRQHLLTREAPITSIGQRDRSITVLASAEVEDRHGSIISQQGLHWPSDQNIPVLVSHEGTPVARTREIRRGVTEDNVPATFATIQFPAQGMVPSADEAYASIRAGLIDSISIGFFCESAQTRSDGLLQIDSAELCELSLVSIPAQPRATITSIHQAPQLETRQPPRQELARTIVQAPRVLEKKASLAATTMLDYAALSAEGAIQTQRDLGPAREMDQEFTRLMGGYLPKDAPSNAKRFPLSLLLRDPERRMEDAKYGRRQGDTGTLPGGSAAALATEVLQRNMLQDLVAAMREQTYFGSLGIRTLVPTEQVFVVPSITSQGTGAAYIARDTAAALSPSPETAAQRAEPHTAAVVKRILRSSMEYTAGMAEEMIRRDMSAEFIQLIQNRFLYGNAVATPAEPEGLIRAGVTVMPAGDPLEPERGNLEAFMDGVENTPLPDSELVWLMPPRLRRRLYRTYAYGDPAAPGRFSDTMLLMDGAPGGPLLGYPLITSRYLRSTIGAAPNDNRCDVFFGSFRESYFLAWQSALISYNPFIEADWMAGHGRLRILADHDFLFRDRARIVYTDRYEQDIAGTWPVPPP